MITIISPAKTLDFNAKIPVETYSKPDYIPEATNIVSKLKEYAPADLRSLLKVSEKLAELNYNRFNTWNKVHTPEHAKQAMFIFKGDVYQGLNASTMNQNSIEYAQSHLRILSGLYGILRPLDLIRAYRLEMGTKLSFIESSLHAFWQKKITEHLNQLIKKTRSKALVNLASNEYFKAIETSKLNADIITPVFFDNKNGKYRIISFYAKKARGMMTRFIMGNKINNPEYLEGFQENGYIYNKEMSGKGKIVFNRG